MSGERAEVSERSHPEKIDMRNDLPLLYRWLRAHGLSALRPWHFIDDERRIVVLIPGHTRRRNGQAG